jgi:hypothetical protein
MRGVWNETSGRHKLEKWVDRTRTSQPPVEEVVHQFAHLLARFGLKSKY